MKRTLLDPYFWFESREMFHLSIAAIQRDDDAFMRHYNAERSHQGYRPGA